MLFIIAPIIKTVVIAGIIVFLDMQFNFGITEWVLQMLEQYFQNQINPF